MAKKKRVDNKLTKKGPGFDKLVVKFREPTFYRASAIFLLVFMAFLLILNPNSIGKLNKSRIDITYENYCFNLDLSYSNRCDSESLCNEQCVHACSDKGMEHDSTSYEFDHCTCFCV